MLVFLETNKVSVEYEDEELIETILGVAAGDVSAEELIAWLFEHINEK